MNLFLAPGALADSALKPTGLPGQDVSAQAEKGFATNTGSSPEQSKGFFHQVLHAQRQGIGPEQIHTLPSEFPLTDFLEGALPLSGLETNPFFQSQQPLPTALPLVIAKQIATGAHTLQLQTGKSLVEAPSLSESFVSESGIAGFENSLANESEGELASAVVSIANVDAQKLQFPEETVKEAEASVLLPASVPTATAPTATMQASGATDFLTSGKSQAATALPAYPQVVSEQAIKTDVKNLSPQRSENTENKSVLTLDVSKGLNTTPLLPQTKNPGAALQAFSTLTLNAQTPIEKVSIETASLEKVDTLASQFNPGLQAVSAKANPENARMQMPLTLQFGHAEWANQVAERSAMMSAQKIRFAEMQLDPPELGALQVRVSVNQDQQATVTFTSPHASVRDALDQTVMRLREMLEEQGVDLVDVNVSDHPQAEEEEQTDSFTAGSESTEAEDSEIVDSEARNVLSAYGVDYYA